MAVSIQEARAAKNSLKSQFNSQAEFFGYKTNGIGIGQEKGDYNVRIYLVQDNISDGDLKKLPAKEGNVEIKYVPQGPVCAQ